MSQKRSERNIKSSTALIFDTIYAPGNKKSHSRQVVRERLGKVVIYVSNKKGLFQFSTRSLV